MDSKMKFSDEMALMFLMKSILLTEGIRGKKMHFLNTRVLALWQNIFHPQMFCLSCQLFSMSAINQSLCCQLKDFFSSSPVKATGSIKNTTAINHTKSFVMLMYLVPFSPKADWAKYTSWILGWIFLSFLYLSYMHSVYHNFHSLFLGRQFYESCLSVKASIP